MSTSVSLMEHYSLNEQDCSKQFQDKLLDKIADTYCREWRKLRSQFEMPSIVEHDIDHSATDEENKRRDFLLKWKRVKGSAATPKALINALLEIKCRDDAEGVCQLLQQWLAKEAKRNIAGKSVLSSVAASSTGPSSTVLDPEVREDLKYILKQNRKQIINQYARYVSCLCSSLKKKGVDVEELSTFVLQLPAFSPDEEDELQDKRLLSEMKMEIEEAKTVNKIFNLIGDKCASFLNYDIFQSILENYCSDMDCEQFQYPEKLQAYIDRHNIKEFFEINPQLEKFVDKSKKLKLKIDIDVTTKAAKIVDLKSSVASVLGLNPSALRLFSIEEGCVIATFLIPVSIAQAIFTRERGITSGQREGLRGLKVLWMKCDDYEYDFCQHETIEEEVFPYTLQVAAPAPTMLQEGFKRTSDRCPTGDSGIMTNTGTTRSNANQFQVSANTTSVPLKKQRTVDSGMGSTSVGTQSRGHTKDHGSKPAFNSYGETAMSASLHLSQLMTTARTSSDQLKQLLEGFKKSGMQLKKIINTHLEEYKGRTLVHIAADCGSFGFLELLLKYGGSPNAISFAEDLNQTPLHLAARRGSLETIKVLLDHGASIASMSLAGETPQNLVQGNPILEEEFQYALAVKKIPQRTEEELSILTSLHHGKLSLKDFCKLYEQLPSRHINLTTRWTDLDNITLLCRAASSGSLNVVEYLLGKSKCQPLPNLLTNETPLLIGCKGGNCGIVSALLEHSPKLLFVSDAGSMVSPLHVACSTRNTEMVRLILHAMHRYMYSSDCSSETEISLDFRDKCGRTPLYLSCYYGYFDMAELLVEFYLENCSRISLNIFAAAIESRQTPLHLAVGYRRLDILQLLLLVTDHTPNPLGQPSKRTQWKLVENYRKSMASAGLPAPDLSRFCGVFENPVTGEMDFYKGDFKKLASLDFNYLFMTPLAEACACLHTEIVEVLLSHGARDKNGLACRIAHFLQRPDLVHLILTYHTVWHRDSKTGNLELHWNNMKLPLCNGSWLGDKVDCHIVITDHENARSKSERTQGTFQGNKIQFHAVTAVYLNDNQLLSLPIELFQLQNVRKIDVSSNSITYLPTLRSVSHSQDKSGGWRCSFLVELNLSKNIISHLPLCVWNLPSLTTLLCCYNKIKSLQPGQGQELVRELVKMESVDLSNNHIVGEVPAFLFNFPGLKMLNLSHNMITDLPGTLWKCHSLEDFNVSQNRLKTLPLLCTHAVSMEMKTIASEPHVGATHDRLIHIHHKRTPSTTSSKSLSSHRATSSDFSSLKKLNLSGNKIPIFPEGLPCLAPNLTSLDVSSNPLLSIDVHFLPQSLKTLTASKCELLVLGSVITKQHLDQLNQNCMGLQLEGCLCQHHRHTSLPYLTTLDLSCNKLSHMQLLYHEPPPDALKNFGELENKYDPKVDPAIDLLFPALEELNLAGNQLIGKFNPNIGHQSHLKQIWLDNNTPLEEIPMEFAYLRNTNQFTKLGLHGLPNLTDPPAHYQEVDLQHLLTYMRSRLKESTQCRTIKLFIIGNSRRGKTTLLHRLRHMSEGKNVERTAGIDIVMWTYPEKKRLEKRNPVNFIAWDFAGQEVYHSTHQCFYSRHSMYLALFRLTDGEEGIEELDHWLRSVQLRAPGCPAIIIGTHLDAMPDIARVRQLERVARDRYSGPNYPTIIDVVSITCLKRRMRSAVENLRQQLYFVACHLKLGGKDGTSLEYKPDIPETDTKALFQQMIPQTFLAMQNRVMEKVKELHTNGQPPIMETEAFQSFLKDLYDDEDELSEAVHFMKLHGNLLHFEDHNLRNVYFLDPQWLAKLMADVIHPVAIGNDGHIKDGVVEISNLFTQRSIPPHTKDHYITLLEKFELALKINHHQMIIPSLTSERAFHPAILGAMESCHFPPLRRFWFAYFVPEGFWPRLICRIATDQHIAHVFSKLCSSIGPSSENTFSLKSNASRFKDALHWTPWKTGVAFSYQGHSLITVKQESGEPSDEFLEMWQFDASLVYYKYRIEVHISMNEWEILSCKNFKHLSMEKFFTLATKLMLMITVHIKALATIWFPGMLASSSSESFVTYIPCWKCCAMTSMPRDFGKFPLFKEDMFTCIESNPIALFVLDEHIVTAALKKTLKCCIHGDIDIVHMAPDLVFLDLSADFGSDPLEIHEDEVLGRGGFGFVCKGELLSTTPSENPDAATKKVAVKMFLKGTKKIMGSTSIRDLLELSQDPKHLIYAYKQIRQEVSFLANLSHPNLTKLCGVRTSPYMCLILELAPQKSLRYVLQAYNECGVILEPLMLKNTALQIAKGLEYLHSHQVVHLDMKSPNVLIWKFPAPQDSRQLRIRHSNNICIKIADYGISRISTGLSLRVDSSPVGTPGYIAPELFGRVGQLVSAEKVDVFGYGMVLYELLSRHAPFADVHPALKRNRKVKNGYRPILQDNKSHSPVKLQELMKICWDKEPDNRPNMRTVVNWIQAPEFELLREEITLKNVKSFLCACTCRIATIRSDGASNLLSMRAGKSFETLEQEINIIPNEAQPVPTISSENSMGNSGGRVTGMKVRESHEDTAIENSLAVSGAVHDPYTQIWLCGEKGLVDILTYYDNYPGNCPFSGTFSNDNITSICAVCSLVWMGTSDGALKIIDAHTLETRFLSTLEKEKGKQQSILDILHIKETHTVLVSFSRGEVWSFLDTIIHNELKLQCKIVLPGGSPCYHLVKVTLDQKIEAWGTIDSNRLLIMEHPHSNWQHHEILLQSKTHSCSHIAFTHFTDNSKGVAEHIWVSSCQNNTLVSYDGRTRKQRSVHSCARYLKSDGDMSFQISALTGIGNKVFVGTTGGVVTIIDSESSVALDCIRWHEGSICKLLSLPHQIEPCICAEVPLPQHSKAGQHSRKTDGTTIMMSVGHGKEEYHVNTQRPANPGGLNQAAKDSALEVENNLVLLVWKY